MSGFGWKKKRTQLQTEASEIFNQEEVEEDENSWLTPAKLQKLVMLEDNETASSRLKQQGVILAENERF